MESLLPPTRGEADLNSAIHKNCDGCSSARLFHQPGCYLMDHLAGYKLGLMAGSVWRP